MGEDFGIPPFILIFAPPDTRIVKKKQQNICYEMTQNFEKENDFQKTIYRISLTEKSWEGFSPRISEKIQQILKSGDKKINHHSIGIKDSKSWNLVDL